MKIIIPFLLLVGLSTCHAANENSCSILNLTCEYSTNPIGIDSPIPRLGWNIESQQRNWTQTAYHILVASDSLKLTQDNGDIWNTHKVLSSECLHIEYSGKPLKPLQKYWWKVKVWDKNGIASEWSNPVFWSMSMLSSSDWKGEWIASDLELTELQKELKALPDFSMDTETEMWKLNEQIRKRTDGITSAPAVYLRKEFESNKKVEYAVANICGLGLNELYLNGTKVTDELLNPASSDYQKSVYYQSYDVTRFIKKGLNTTGVILGNGWFNLIIPHALQYYTADYISPPQLLFQIDIFYDDGTKSTIVSDDSWKFTTDGPIQFNNLLSGETYDAQKEIKGWNENGYNDSKWKQAQITEAPTGKLKSQQLHSVRVTDSVKAIGIKSIENGYSIDLEKEITGWCRINVKGKKGDRITIKYPGGSSHTLGRYQTYEFILKGENAETFEPKFSYNGIKSVEIFGLDYKPKLSDITGIIVNSDLPATGSFSCSNDAFNELYSILMHTMRNYVVHIPNDPVREKSGWTQDVQNAFDVYAHSFDCKNMYTKWQHDFIDIIHDNGYVPPVAPGRFDGPTINGPWWGGMIVYLPWKIYEYYGDKRILEESYSAMKAQTNYLMSIDSTYIVNWGLGDWYEPGSMRPVMTPVAVTSTIGYYNTVVITAKSAMVLGHQDEADYYFGISKKIKDAFNQAFFNSETGEYAKYSQASQLMPLYFDLTPEDKRPLVLDKLVSKIEADSNHVGTGFVATPYILTGLSDMGHGDLAYAMANQKTYPSWYDMVFNHGSKIFKEDWKGGLVQMPPLGGGLGHWFYHSLAGIQPDPLVPGFKKVVIRPDIIRSLSWAKGEYKSIYGNIKSEWVQKEGVFSINVEIPANTTARIYLPTSKVANITESDKSISNSKDFFLIDPTDTRTIVGVGSGKYSFKVKLNN